MDAIQFSPILHDLIAATAPINGISIGDPSDKTTWDIYFTADATASQQAAALAVLAAFNPSAPVIPTSVTPRQARIALLGAGLLPQVEAAVASVGGATQITWDYATQITRDDPLIQTLGTVLKLSSAQIDALFQLASTL